MKWLTKNQRCCNCHKTNTEFYTFKLLWVIDYNVCQACVSRAFKGFVKGK